MLTMNFKHLKEINLGCYLREKRIAAGLSQKAVSLNLGYESAQFVSNWERGLSEVPANTLEKLCVLYKIPVDDIFQICLETSIRAAKLHLSRELGINLVRQQMS
ncbi:MAG: XRE family transcriptional regulator [Proteobacteria bacterium]|nr:MAG: XRE family transcriptional regulator [Pseudomonadota bacterium]